jgi:hypothetical protein
MVNLQTGGATMSLTFILDQEQLEQIYNLEDVTSEDITESLILAFIQQKNEREEE